MARIKINIDKSDALATILAGMARASVVISQAVQEVSNDSKSTKYLKEDDDDERYTIKIDSFDKEFAKDYAIISSKIKSIDREKDDWWTYHRVCEIADYVSDEGSKSVQTYAIIELTKIAEKCEDRYYRRKMFERIGEI